MHALFNNSTPMAQLQYLSIAMALLAIASFRPCESATGRSIAKVSLSTKVRHELWMQRHGRVYKDDAEKQLRRQIFAANLQHIESSNKQGGRKYKLGINKFADLTDEEYKAARYSFARPNNTISAPKVSLMSETDLPDLPESIDWRDHGAVTPIKDQGLCGCCWTFSAVAATEGITMLKTRKLVSLSEQQLLDCVTGTYDRGCNGGVKEDAFQYIVDNGGITTESSYPYIGNTTPGISSCNNPATRNAAATISGYVSVPQNDEAALLRAVAKQPVSVLVDGNSDDFRFYKGGIFGGPVCGTALDHAVTIIGYGTDPEDGTKYWIVKNSWGTFWGENGYMKIQRDVEEPQGQCGLAMVASYPTV